MADAVPPLKGVDLFCGAGGLSQGLRFAGVQLIAGSDFDPDALATFAANFPDADAILGDIRDPDIRERVVAAARGADIVVGGPPCQAFSQVRNHSRIIDDPRNSLYRQFVSVVGDSLPSAFLMENVPGLAQMGVREQVITDLSLDGEYVVTAQLVDSADFGVPQTRKRLLFLGVRAPRFAQPPVLQGTGATDALFLNRVSGRSGSRYRVALRPHLHAERLAEALADDQDSTVVSARQAIGDLRNLRCGRRDDALAALPEPSSAYQRLMRHGVTGPVQNVSVPRSLPDTLLRLKGIPPGGNHRDLPDELLQRYLTAQRWGQHNGTGMLGRRHYYAYRRLHPDIWAWTLNTKADSVYHFSTARCLSVREFARLQSFPDDFVVVTDPRSGTLPGRMTGGAAHSRYRQIGNAVPPLLAAAAARAIAEKLTSPTASAVA